ncbi:MAG: creatininase family protein [Promethearchaeota archaeon]
MIPEADPFRFEYMTPPKVREVVRECPVAIQPSGLLEWHGDHNAVGLDALKAYYACERAVVYVGGGALFPVNWVGTYGFTRYDGTVCFEWETTKSVFAQLYRQLVKLGFRVAFILTGHYGEWQMSALNAAREEVEAELGTRGVSARLFGAKPPDLVGARVKGEHAGISETSMLWAAGRAWGVELVHPGKIKSGREVVPRFDIPDESVPVREPEVWEWSDELGDPAACNPEAGEELVDLIARGVACEVLDALEELGYDYTPPGGPVTPPI